MPQWYLRTPTGEVGPFTSEQICAFIDKGKVGAKAAIREAAGTWMSVQTAGLLQSGPASTGEPLSAAGEPPHRSGPDVADGPPDGSGPDEEEEAEQASSPASSPAAPHWMPFQRGPNPVSGNRKAASATYDTGFCRLSRPESTVVDPSLPWSYFRLLTDSMVLGTWVRSALSFLGWLIVSMVAMIISALILIIAGTPMTAAIIAMLFFLILPYGMSLRHPMQLGFTEATGKVHTDLVAMPSASMVILYALAPFVISSIGALGILLLSLGGTAAIASFTILQVLFMPLFMAAAIITRCGWRGLSPDFHLELIQHLPLSFWSAYGINLIATTILMIISVLLNELASNLLGGSLFGSVVTCIIAAFLLMYPVTTTLAAMGRALHHSGITANGHVHITGRKWAIAVTAGILPLACFCIIMSLVMIKNSLFSEMGLELTSAEKSMTLKDLRAGFSTRLTWANHVSYIDNDRAPPPKPPEKCGLELVRYASGCGSLAAYVSRNPDDGNRHPALIWIHGGDTNAIGEVWDSQDPRSGQGTSQNRLQGGESESTEPDADQNVLAFHRAGIITMYPSQRGGNDNPGQREGFVGEVDDIIAASAYLASLPYVDPDRLYLGGHSTGGTLAMLAGESTDRFRAVFIFGPVKSAFNYWRLPPKRSSVARQEIVVRAPSLWMFCVRKPMYVFEGSDGNASDLQYLKRKNDNPLIRFFLFEGQDHFSILTPLTERIATHIRDGTMDERPDFSRALD